MTLDLEHRLIFKSSNWCLPLIYSGTKHAKQFTGGGTDKNAIPLGRDIKQIYSNKKHGSNMVLVMLRPRRLARHYRTR
jgi:hypothetical protein